MLPVRYGFAISPPKVFQNSTTPLTLRERFIEAAEIGDINIIRLLLSAREIVQDPLTIQDAKVMASIWNHFAIYDLLENPNHSTQ